MLSDARLAHLFLALLEPPEIVLYEERRVELADRYVVTLSCRHNTEQSTNDLYVLNATLFCWPRPHIRRTSPGDSMRRGQRTFRAEGGVEDRHTCYPKQ